MSRFRAPVFARRLGAILIVGFLVRIVYVLLQPRFDPTFARPILDGAFYVSLAHAIASGASPSGVHYMPPLYPAALAAFLRVLGEAWTVLYLAQQAMVVAATGLLALATRRAAGEPAALFTAAIALLYHPTLFFASRPLGEPLALLLLAAAVALALRDDSASGFAAGLAAGLACLARPNLLPLPALWSAGEAWHRRWRRGAALAAAVAFTILPTTCHNFAASRKLVPVSANGGVVFWLGNAPGAVGVYTPSAGFTGALATQQNEAIAEASAREGRPLDAVAADGFFWREGFRARTADPWGTVALLARRVALTFDNAEHGLDYAPALDANPLRWAAPLPFALILGLAVFGLLAAGFDRTGGFVLWSAVVVAAAAPIVFYVSSRHRLPLAFLLAVPAGTGLSALRTRRRWAASVAVAACGLSLAVPSHGLARTERAGALATLADVERKAGDLAAAESYARRATELDAANAVAWFNLGVVEAAQGKPEAAERDYRAALSADPTQPDAAANLAGILVAGGRAGEAPALLERALAVWPRHSVGWTNLVVAYAALGDRARARDAMARGLAAGVAFDPELVAALKERP